MGVNVRGIAYGLACAVLWVPGTALGRGEDQSGTSLQAAKTIDICVQSDGLWRFSGVITVSNTGAQETQNLTITDRVEWKKGNMDWTQLCYALVGYAGQIPALQTATFPYACVSPPPPGWQTGVAIRNQALVTITNHSGQLGQPFGPNPKASWEGGFPPPACPVDLGCTYTQGYWKNHSDNWPTDYQPSASFYFSGQTWLQVLLTEPQGNAYYILAHQYIAAVLNKANGAYVPAGIQSILDSAASWFNSNYPSSCAEKGSCQEQKDWAAVLDTYNQGNYPGGPPHCEDGTGY
jgi:hypothetical protein